MCIQLVIVRHAIAGDRDAWAKTGEDDSKRSITDAGRRSVKRVARGLVELVQQVDTIATSPLVRAVQTAKILSNAWDGPKPKRIDALLPGAKREDLMTWLEEQSEAETIALVGHEPSLGLIGSWLLASPLNHFIELKKGGACLLEWQDAPAAGTAWLRWMMPPAALRRIGA